MNKYEFDTVREEYVHFIMKFDKDQLLEINAATMMGLTTHQVAILARPEFSYKVISHIKYSIIDGMGEDWLGFMANPRFNYPQMTAIKTAFDAGMDLEWVKANFNESLTFVEMVNHIREFISNSKITTVSIDRDDPIYSLYPKG